MTHAELQEFAISALIEEYSHTNVDKLVRHSEDFNSGADFSFEQFGRTFCCKVVYAQDYKVDLNKIDTSLIYSNYRKGSIIPRLYLASAYCVSSEDGSMLCGGDYIFKFHAMSLMNDEVNRDLDVIHSHTTLVKKYIELWESGDTELILKYFDKFVRSYPLNMFDPTVSRKEYLDFFSSNWVPANIDNNLKMTLAKDTKYNEVGVLANKNDKKYYIAITTSNGRIVQLWVRPYVTNRHREYYPQYDLAQSHYEHINAIMPFMTFYETVLPKILESGILYQSIELPNHSISSIRYISGGNDFLALFKGRGTFDEKNFICAYPYLRGRSYDLVIDDVLEWDNGIEATIKCFIGNFHFSFFATDYYLNPDKYISGATLTISLSALGLKVKQGETVLSNDGFRAIRLRAQLDKMPAYDQNGKFDKRIIPLEELVTFISTDIKNLDEAEFQSVIKDLEAISLIGQRFTKGQIIINHANHIEIPLYFNSDLLEHIRENESICGRLWLMGRITNR